MKALCVSRQGVDSRAAWLTRTAVRVFPWQTLGVCGAHSSPSCSCLGTRKVQAQKKEANWILMEPPDPQQSLVGCAVRIWRIK